MTDIALSKLKETIRERFSVSSRTRPNEAGPIRTANTNANSPATEAALLPPPKAGLYYLRTIHNNYLSLQKEGITVVAKDAVGEFERVLVTYLENTPAAFMALVEEKARRDAWAIVDGEALEEAGGEVVAEHQLDMDASGSIVGLGAACHNNNNNSSYIVGGNNIDAYGLSSGYHQSSVLSSRSLGTTSPRSPPPPPAAAYEGNGSFGGSFATAAGDNKSVAGYTPSTTALTNNSFQTNTATSPERYPVCLLRSVGVGKFMTMTDGNRSHSLCLAARVADSGAVPPEAVFTIRPHPRMRPLGAYWTLYNEVSRQYVSALPQHQSGAAAKIPKKGTLGVSKDACGDKVFVGSPTIADWCAFQFVVIEDTSYEPPSTVVPDVATKLNAAGPKGEGSAEAPADASDVSEAPNNGSGDILVRSPEASAHNDGEAEEANPTTTTAVADEGGGLVGDELPSTSNLGAYVAGIGRSDTEVGMGGDKDFFEVDSSVCSRIGAAPTSTPPPAPTPAMPVINDNASFAGALAGCNPSSLSPMAISHPRAIVPSVEAIPPIRSGAYHFFARSTNCKLAVALAGGSPLGVIAAPKPALIAIPTNNTEVPRSATAIRVVACKRPSKTGHQPVSTAEGVHHCCYRIESVDHNVAIGLDASGKLCARTCSLTAAETTSPELMWSIAPHPTVVCHHAIQHLHSGKYLCVDPSIALSNKMVLRMADEAGPWEAFYIADAAMLAGLP